MHMNREKVVFALALVLSLGGLYRVTVGLVTPRPDIRIPDTRLPPQRREIPPPRFPYFKPEAVASRNPFSFSEGWRRLESLPLPPPPIPAGGAIVPLVGRSAHGRRPAPSPGFVYLEGAPRETKDPLGAAPEGGN